MESYNYPQQPFMISCPQPSSWANVTQEEYNSSSTTTTTTTLIAKHPKERRSNAKRCNSHAGIKLSTDPQSVAARQRRHRISDRFRVLKSLVPGGSKMDTVSMLEEAINYVKFLKTQIWLHQAAMMVPNEELIPSYYSTNPSVNYDANFVPAQEMLSYSPPTLAPFPYSSFQEEEEMIPDFSIKY